MRDAPPVDMVLTRAGGWALAAGLLAGLAAAVPLVWLAWQLEVRRDSGTTMRWLLAAAALAAAGVATGATRRHLCQLQPVVLRWTGAAWQLVRPTDGRQTSVTRLATCIDLGRALLLRARAAEPGWPVWLPLARSTSPVAWHGLRVALNQNRTAGHTGTVPEGGAP